MVKRIIKQLIFKLARVEVRRVGMSEFSNVRDGAFRDILTHLPNQSVLIVFDVGANCGQSVRRFKSEFPDSSIFCFEPVSQTYNALIENVHGFDNVRCFQFALGEEECEKEISVDANHLDMARFSSNGFSGSEMELVRVRTLDNVIIEMGIDKVDYLKIDSEGYEIEILKGAISSLKRQAFDIVELEVGMSHRNKYHVPFEEVKSVMQAYKYAIFGIYEQVREWKEREPNLRRANVVFISERVITRNRKELESDS